MPVQLEDLAPLIRVSVPEAPDPLVYEVLRQAAREFCAKTFAVRHKLSLTTVADPVTHTYLLPIAADTDLVQIHSVKPVETKPPLIMTTPARLNTEDPAWESAAPAEPTHFFKSTSAINSITLVRSPSAVFNYSVEVSTQPTRTALTLDDQLVESYERDLIHGALGVLLLIPRKSWTSVDVAAYHRNQFQDAIDIAIERAADLGQVGVIRTVHYHR